jgi:hypothetical protein
MIGFNHLGRYGRLGNQMFQYAALRGIAAIKGYDFCIPDSNFKNEWQDHQLFEAFKLSNLKNIRLFPGNYYQEKKFSFDYEYVEKCPDNINLYGYFQSEKYFKHIENSIREDFQFKDEILNSCKESFNFDEIISLHVRRTDYVGNENHPLCSISYYEKAIARFNSDIPIIVFSDDVKWCKTQEIFSEDRFLISESDWNVIDLCLMSMCSHHIISNSSFSWWGAWLSNSKNVIAPKKWFGDAVMNNTDDLYLSNWELIDD